VHAPGRGLVEGQGVPASQLREDGLRLALEAPDPGTDAGGKPLRLVLRNLIDPGGALPEVAPQRLDVVTQRRERIDDAYHMGKGKVESIAARAHELEAGVIIFDNDLTPAQVRNLERITGCRVGEFLGALLYPLAASAVMAAVIVMIQTVAGPGYGIAVFIVVIVVGMGVYGAAAWGLGRLFRIDITEAFRAYRNE